MVHGSRLTITVHGHPYGSRSKENVKGQGHTLAQPDPFYCRVRDENHSSSVGIVIGFWAEQSRSRGLIPGKYKGFLSTASVQQLAVTHIASY